LVATEAQAAGSGAQPTGHRRLGRGRLAADQKKSRRLGATLVFFDETGFLTQPYGQRTWGPIGQTPVIRHRLRHRDKLTVLGSVSVSPARRRCGLYAEFLPGRSVNQQDLIAHFRRLRRTFRTPLVIVLDNLGQHKGRELHDWCPSVGDVPLEYLPPYAPELNPAEGVWGHGKCVTAAGRLVDDAAQLEQLAREAITAADQQHLLRGFIRGTSLPFQFNLTATRKHHSECQ
jgi:DDE superfamily endonuclease